MCNFKIGDRVVYIGDDLKFDPNPGKTEHIVKGIRQSCCNIEIDVGILNSKTGRSGITCIDCGRGEETHIWWKKASSFRPLITDYTAEELASVDISPLIEELELETV